MSSQERRNKRRRGRGYFVSSPVAETRVRLVSAMQPEAAQEQEIVENCAHGKALGTFCLPCADEISRRGRIDVV